MRFSTHKYLSLRLTIVITILLMLSGCAKVDDMKEIKQIFYTSDSGTILPELQWHEEYVIDQDSVTFKRNGTVENTSVNTGEWLVEVDQNELTTLLATLGSVKYNNIKRIEPQEIPEGGGSDGYRIIFANGDSFSMDFTPGVTYSNADLITVPVQSFIGNLDLPTEAESQQLLP